MSSRISRRAGGSRRCWRGKARAKHGASDGAHRQPGATRVSRGECGRGYLGRGCRCRRMRVRRRPVTARSRPSARVVRARGAPGATSTKRPRHDRPARAAGSRAVATRLLRSFRGRHCCAIHCRPRTSSLLHLMRGSTGGVETSVTDYPTTITAMKSSRPARSRSRGLDHCRPRGRCRAREDRPGEDRAREQAADLEPDDREHGQERVAQRMPQDHRAA